MEEFQLNKYMLTQRETEVLKYILQGFTNEQIAEKLFIHTYTVKAHISSILYKMNAHDRLDIILKIFNKDIKEFLNKISF